MLIKNDIIFLGEPGMRHSLPNSRIMIHQPTGGAHGQATDIQIQAEEIQKLKNKLTNIYAKHTKQPFDLLLGKMERDTFLDPEEAKNLGIIDTVLEQPPTATENTSN